jgi:hypothetical protein
LTARQPGRAYLDAYRARCIERDLDPATGGQRVFAWPEERKQPCGRPWWAGVDVFSEIGPNASTVEAEAFASIASQVRRIAGVPEPETVADAVRAAWVTDGAERMHQMIMPLREKLASRGETIDTILGVRMVVPIRRTA